MQKQFSSVGAAQDAGNAPPQAAEVDMELMTAHLLSTHSKLAGLELFTQFLAAGNTLLQLLTRQNAQGKTYTQAVFKGLRGCLTVPESEVDILLKCNQLLYDTMSEIHKSPSELQPEVASLIPWFIENLGNPKVSVVVSTNTKLTINYDWL